MATKTYPLEVDEDLWDLYRDSVPRNTTLDEPIIDFIRSRVDEQEN